MTIHLIVNADDYGLTPGVCEGIREAHHWGMVTSTTAMMNMPAVAPELDKLLRETPQLGLGVHLVLTAGKPLLPQNQMKTLVTEGGWFLKQEQLAKQAERINLDAVREEWQAQIARFRQITGRSPDHLDSHHHSSYFTPAIFQLMVDLAKEIGCPIRLPEDMISDGTPGEDEKAQAYQEILSGSGVPHPNQFISSFYDPRDAQAELSELLTRLSREDDAPGKRRIVELMCHPGYADADLRRVSSYTDQRQAELRALIAVKQQGLLKTLGIRRIHFGSLAR